ncbi:MAG: dicarboxylate/amino acid:cation symporter [Rudaea sp.]|nr:dicarboxylate/amino acid:cation symporter [Rudaea sp.]
MHRALTLMFVAAMLLGVAAGWACNHYLTPDQAIAVAANLAIVTDAFLRLIKMIIAPLVFSSLVAAIARMQGIAEIGRVGLKAMAWFIAASCISLTVGMLMAHWLQPGSGLGLAPSEASAAGVDAAKFTLQDFVAHLVPRSIFEALAGNEILQIVIFSIFVGTAITALDDKAPQVVAFAEQVTRIMLKVTDYVMKTAPLAIFAALAATVSVQGIGIVVTYAKFVIGFYLSLGVLWVTLIAALLLIVGRPAMRLLAGIREPVVLAFATASSEAAYPRTLEALIKFGIPPRVASFVLPLGYSFNLDGAMMYCTFATLFIVQAYAVQLSITQQITMFGLMMLTTKGLAGVPRAALVVIAATLPYFNLPESGLLLVLAVDQFLDMGRSATNVLGNSIAAAVVAKWEKRIESLATLELS